MEETVQFSYPSGAVRDADLSDPSFTDEEVIEGVDRWYHARLACDRALMSFILGAEHRGIHKRDGFASIEDWTANRFGMGYTKAVEFVTIARCLNECEAIDRAYSQGRVSYDHLRAICPIANYYNETALLDAVEGRPAADAFKLFKKIIAVSAEDSRYLRAERWMQMRWDDQLRMLYVYAQLPEDQGAAFEKAIDALATKIPDDPSMSGHTPLGTKRADALSELAGAVLSQLSPSSQIVIHVEAKALVSDEACAEIEGGPAISVETARRLMCDSVIQTVVENPDGDPISMGRAKRFPPPYMKRELRRRDNHCRFPQCRRKKSLIAHHILWWGKDMGPTDWDNLVMLCPGHHYLVHEGGWTIIGEPPEVSFVSPAGRQVKPGPPPVPEEIAMRFGPEFALALGGAQSSRTQEPSATAAVREP
ncbi:MAG: DUF222 domain-containing protein [Actinomycetota bacterium]